MTNRYSRPSNTVAAGAASVRPSPWTSHQSPEGLRREGGIAVDPVVTPLDEHVQPVVEHRGGRRGVGPPIPLHLKPSTPAQRRPGEMVSILADNSDRVQDNVGLFARKCLRDIWAVFKVTHDVRSVRGEIVLVRLAR